MKAVKAVTAVSIAVALGFGITGCGPSEPPYTGDAVVVSKDKDVSTKSSTKKKSSSKKTDYDIVVDIPNSDINKSVGVSKSQYNSIEVGQTVKLEKGKLPKGK